MFCNRYFRGKDLVVLAVRPLNPGEVVADNYGPVFTMRTRDERQKSLAGRYWFRCACMACCEDWPKLAELGNMPVRIRYHFNLLKVYISTLNLTNK